MNTPEMESMETEDNLEDKDGRRSWDVSLMKRRTVSTKVRRFRRLRLVYSALMTWFVLSSALFVLGKPIAAPSYQLGLSATCS